MLHLINSHVSLRTPKHSPSSSRRSSHVSRSGSVPNLHEGECTGIQSPHRNCLLSKGAVCIERAERNGSQKQPHHHHHYHTHHRSNASGHHRRSGGSRHSSLTKRSTREQQTDRYLHPGMLKYHRHAVSVDESHPPPCLRPILSNSRQNVLLGSHPTISCSTSPTHEMLQMHRSDTAKQRMLARQKNIIEREETHNKNNNAISSPKYHNSSYVGGRR